MDILKPGEYLPEQDWKTNADNPRDELFDIISKTQSSISNETLKKIIADCLWSDQDFGKYIETNNIDLKNEEFIKAVESWALTITTLPEQLLLYKIAEEFVTCCQAQCTSAFCPSNVLHYALKINNLTFTDKLSLLSTLIQSHSISNTYRTRIMRSLLGQLLYENSKEHLQEVYDILNNIKVEDLWNKKFGQIQWWAIWDWHEFLTLRKKNFKDKIEGLQ